MKSIFDVCQPRPEVLEGELTEDIFAARLRDVIEKRAETIYGEPEVFFENTYPTEGLKTLLTEALGRLTGVKRNSPPILRLETSFGGGKTHNLIALYHLARHGLKPKAVERFIDAKFLPKEPIRLVAGVVGSDMEPAAGFLHKDTGIRTYTIGGEIAHQLKGKKGYEIVRAADEGKSAIGTNVLDQIIGDEPCLILLDEMGRFLRDASSVAVPANASVTLAKTTIATLMSLFEFAASKSKVVVVLSLADSKDAFAKETDEIRFAMGKLEIAEAKKVAARHERILAPSKEDEMSAIVTHRLFREIDRVAARKTAEAYHAYYETVCGQDQEFAPSSGVRDQKYTEEILHDYPFHPSFLVTLRRKTSTIPSFQQTRGALRLLACAIRGLWKAKPEGVHLFHSHHLDFANEETLNDLTSRLERPQFRQVVEADIVSPRQGIPAHSHKLDAVRVKEGKPAYAYRLSCAIFLHSLTQGVASGVDRAELAEAVMEPGDDAGVLKRVLGDLEDRCWFLDYDGDRFRFRTEPSLNKLVADEVQAVLPTRAKEELQLRIERVWQKGVFRTRYFKSDASELEDDAGDPIFAIIHFDAARARDTDAQQTPPDLLKQLFLYSGSSGGYRSYKNNLLFLVADEDQADRMVEMVRRHLAIERILSDGGRMADFTREQADKLKAARDAAELDVRVAITRAYRFLFYPSAEAPKTSEGLKRYSLPAQEQGEVKQDQSLVILKVLRQLGKVLTSDESARAPLWLREKAWPANREEVATEEIRREFARRLSLPFLIDPAQLKETIRQGIRNGDWIYYVAEERVGYGKSSPPPMVEISDDTSLWDSDAAKKKGIPIRGACAQCGFDPCQCKTGACPVCGKEPCRCLHGCPKCGKDPCECKQRILLRAEGAPAQAFQKLLDLCQEGMVESLGGLVIGFQGSGPAGAKELKSIGLGIPQFGKGRFLVTQKLATEFKAEGHLTVDFRGPWDRYKRVKPVTEPFALEASKVSAQTTLEALFEDGLQVPGPQFETIRDVLVGLQFGQIVLEGLTAEDVLAREAGR